ncbi:hypothetical protein ACOKM5_20865 [Streptomyces sp. BH097]|uniref:hypothetical protein n=1 Tax=Streptomyces sp. BH097 TaxID=3410406 RepID=UPI003CF9A6A2
MNTRAINVAARIILTAIRQNRVPAGIATALDNAGLLNTPEHVVEFVSLRERVAELEAAAGKDTPSGDESTQSEFFRTSREYTTGDGWTAPEETLFFRCAHVTTTPTGDRIAFGFVRYGDTEEWTPTGLGTREWMHEHGWHVRGPEGDAP